MNGAAEELLRVAWGEELVELIDEHGAESPVHGGTLLECRSLCCPGRVFEAHTECEWLIENAALDLQEEACECVALEWPGKASTSVWVLRDIGGEYVSFDSEDLAYDAWGGIVDKIEEALDSRDVERRAFVNLGVRLDWDRQQRVFGDRVLVERAFNILALRDQRLRAEHKEATSQ